MVTGEGGTDWRAVTAGLPLPGHFLSVPWPLLGGIVAGLPLLVAAAMALATRSRLPLTARLG